MRTICMSLLRTQIRGSKGFKVSCPLLLLTVSDARGIVRRGADCQRQECNGVLV